MAAALWAGARFDSDPITETGLGRAAGDRVESGAGGLGRWERGFAAPHVAGLAALLVAQLGHGNPALIRARILESADDRGDPGVDPYYGKGRINSARALGLID